MQSLKLSARNRTLLYECYMPFVKNGGLFVPTDAILALGEEVCISLDFPGEPEPLQAVGTVVWITPEGAQGNRVPGVGIGFASGCDAVRRKIETCLEGALESERRTHTL